MKRYTCKKCGCWFDEIPIEHGFYIRDKSYPYYWDEEKCAGEIIESVHDCKSTDWKKEYNGYRCKVCDCFVPYGCEPWMPEQELKNENT
jgi:hypothetical protein